MKYDSEVLISSVHRKEIYKLQFWNYKIYVQIPEISSLVYDFHVFTKISYFSQLDFTRFLTDVSHALQNVTHTYHFCALFIFFNFWVLINPLVNIFIFFSLKTPLLTQFHEKMDSNCIKYISELLILTSTYLLCIEKKFTSFSFENIKCMSKFQKSAVWFMISMFLPQIPISHNWILPDF